MKDRIRYLCPIHGEVVTSAHAHYISASGCDKCGRDVRKLSIIKYRTIEEVMKDIKKVHGDIYQYDTSLLTEPVMKESIIIIKCPKHGVFNSKIRHHIDYASKCKRCQYDAKTSTFEEFVEKSINIHGDNYKYFKDTYTNTNLPTTILHYKCNKTFVRKARKHLEGQYCPHCKYSKGEEKIIRYLIKHKIEYKREYRLDNDKKRFDFYLPKLNILLEYDGEQHFRPIKAWGGDERFKTQIRNDNYKTKLAKQNNIPLIRISYKDFTDMEFHLNYKFYKLRKTIIGNKYFDKLINKISELN